MRSVPVAVATGSNQRDGQDPRKVTRSLPLAVLTSLLNSILGAAERFMHQNKLGHYLRQRIFARHKTSVLRLPHKERKKIK
jgi:hypothetical protein